MSLRIPALDTLVHELSRLPGVGEKTAQRLAFFILKSKSSYSAKLREALKLVEERVHDCPKCFSYTDRPTVCHICDSADRDEQSVCVVEDPSDIFRIENSGAFKGLYHVLQGAISPLEGIRPEDLKIDELLQRVNTADSSDRPIREVILALDADLEGDTTSLYIAKLLSSRGVKITRLAYGVPFGADIDYVDKRTLGRALENRVEL